MAVWCRWARTMVLEYENRSHCKSGGRIWRTPHAWPGLLKRLGSKASQVVTWWTKGPGHAEFLAAQAKRSGFDRVLAVGGDGTISEVANGLWWESEGRLPSLGIVSFGRAATMCAISKSATPPFHHLVHALEESVLTWI